MRERTTHIIALILITLVMGVSAAWAQSVNTTVIYLNGASGNDSWDGLTPAKAVKTIDKANSKLKTPAQGGTWDNNIIVVIGMLNSGKTFQSKGLNPATITGKWGDTDFGGKIQIIKGSGEDNVNKVNQSGQSGHHNYIRGNTKFENLTFECNSATADNNFIECNGHDVWFGKGLIMTNFRNLSKAHGNLDAAQNIPELTVLLMATNLNETDIQTYTNREKPQVLTIESGHYGRIMGGRYTNAFFSKADNTSHTILGSAAHPVWAIINVDIDRENANVGTINRTEAPNTGKVTNNFTCDVNCIIAGLTDGSMYGDFTINVHGGKIGYIVGGNQGNPVPNGTKNFTQPGGNSGNWGQWPNASYFGRTIINVEQDPMLKDIAISNLYTGGLGRDANGSSATSIVDMYLYGHTEINMKSGTVNGNIYGGGAGGVMGRNPWDMHTPYATTDADNADNAIMNKVQYGTWGSVPGGSALAQVVLHDADSYGGYTTTMQDLGQSYTTLNISGGTITGNVYGGGCGYVSNMPYQVSVQGVGSVFGTSNVNISGGFIGGSVYGGSQGDTKYYGLKNKYGQTITHIAEMNGDVNLNISGTEEKWPTIGGNIYGGGKGVASVGGNEYTNIATTGSEDYPSNITITFDMPKGHPFEGNIYGGGEMGTVNGNTNVIILNGEINGSVFGGGKGEEGHPDKAKVTGSTNVHIGEE